MTTIESHPSRTPTRRRSVARAARKYCGSPMAVAGYCILLILVVVALMPGQLAPYDPHAQNVARALEGPSGEHLLGLDQYGRDILSRLMHGARVSLAVGLLAVSMALVVGIPLGIAAGYFGGWVETAIMWVVDVMLSIPGIILALLFVALFGSGVVNMSIAIAIGFVPTFARLSHSPTLSYRQREFVQGSIAFGGRSLWVMRRHIWPNLRSQMLIIGCLTAGTTIRIEAGLSFLGLGVAPPTATWGGMLRDGMLYLQSVPLYSIVAGLAIFSAIVAFNLIGDGLRDILDPRTPERPVG
ncbi:ABC transporter permease [Phytoactinopolyspora limicola]|uniref:ABC transporter permease n=1 Tax=Phytoactinopolyspora limicola TaxID=2715536 RepID=UPI00140E4A88|nr:ABC transporter permease [Phytoactinopolyspora limicola]